MMNILYVSVNYAWFEEDICAKKGNNFGKLCQSLACYTIIISKYIHLKTTLALPLVSYLLDSEGIFQKYYFYSLYLIIYEQWLGCVGK